MKIVCSLLLALLALVGLAFAQITRGSFHGAYGGVKYTYYVKPTGNDGLTGLSPAQAFATIARAETVASAGNTVSIAAGTYTGDWNSAKAIKWYGQGLVTIKTVTLYGAIAITANGAAYQGLTFDGTGASYDNVWLNGAANISFTACSFVNFGSDGVFETLGSTPTTGLTVTRSTFTGHPVVGVFYGNYTSAVITGNTFTMTSGTVRSIIRTKAGINSLTFSNNVVNAAPDATQPSFNLAASDTLIADNNTITLTSAPVAILQSPTSGTGAVTFTNNTISVPSTSAPVINIQSGGAFATNISGNQILVTGTQAYPNNGIMVMTQASPTINGNTVELTAGSADPIWVGSTGAVGASGTIRVTNNICKIHDTAAYHGIVVGADNDPGVGTGQGAVDGAIITGNTVYGPRYYNSANDNFVLHGILFGWAKNATLNNNTLIGTAYGIVAKGMGETWTSGGIMFNFFKDPSTFTSTPLIYAKGVSGVKIYHNTIFASLTTGSGMYFEPIKLDVNGGGQNSYNCDLKNNLVYVKDVYVMAWNGTATGNAWDYNLYFASGTLGINSGRFGYSGGFKSFAQWQSVPLDVNSRYLDPLINSDGTLQPGSPAIGTGVYIAGVSTANPPSIGAFEYGGTAKYYVDPAGSDSNNGRDPTTAIASIGKVNALNLLPGNSVLFKKGATWTGAGVIVPVSGTAGNPITYGNYGVGALPYLNGTGTGSTIDGFHLDARSYITIDGLRIEHFGQRGVQMLTSGNHRIVQNSTLSNNADTGVMIAHGGTLNDLVTNNVIWSNHEGGIKISAFADSTGAEFSYNDIRYNVNDTSDQGDQLRVVNTVSGLKVHHNYLEKTLNYTPLQGNSEGIDIDKGVGAEIHDNVIVNSYLALKLASTGVLIYNNTIYGDQQASALYIMADCTGATVKNNILWNTNATASGFAIYLDPGAETGFVSDYNSFYSANGKIGDRATLSLNNMAEWRSYSGQDANSKYGDPLFTNLTSRDFSLQPGSPAIGAGVYIAGVSTANPSNIGAR